jgi:Transcription factor Tfb2
MTNKTVEKNLKEMNEKITLQGFIIVETNYRIYAYTSSTLQISILSLFINMQTRFANMVVGILNRDSVREALARGITADQVWEILNLDYIIPHWPCTFRNAKNCKLLV